MSIEKISASFDLLNTLRKKKPIVHHITNYVTVNDCANVTLAIGASPIMADDIEEVRDIVSLSQALLLNIGTLNARTVSSMIVAGKKANELQVPVIFDPVGTGASGFRNRTATTILEQIKVNVIRGNMSEIRYIAGLSSVSKGVDASEEDIKSGANGMILAVKELAARIGCVVAVTGETDIISDGERVISLLNGHKMLSGITGSGCMCSSLVSSFCGVTGDHFMGAVLGIASMGIAGELAYERVGRNGTGSCRAALIDEVSKLNPEIISGRIKAYET